MAGPMTQDARTVPVHAYEHAIRLGHRYLGGEHFLPALAGSDQPAGAALRERGVTPERVEAEIIRLSGAGLRTSASYPVGARRARTGIARRDRGHLPAGELGRWCRRWSYWSCLTGTTALMPCWQPRRPAGDIVAGNRSGARGGPARRLPYSPFRGSGDRVMCGRGDALTLARHVRSGGGRAARSRTRPGRGRGPGRSRSRSTGGASSGWRARR